MHTPSTKRLIFNNGSVDVPETYVRHSNRNDQDLSRREPEGPAEIPVNNVMAPRSHRQVPFASEVLRNDSNEPFQAS